MDREVNGGSSNFYMYLYLQFGVTKENVTKEKDMSSCCIRGVCTIPYVDSVCAPCGNVGKLQDCCMAPIMNMAACIRYIWFFSAVCSSRELDHPCCKENRAAENEWSLSLKPYTKK